MEKFTSHTGTALPLRRSNVDTDQIIPKQFLKTIKRTGLGENLFFEMRYDQNGNEIKDFILNREHYSNSSIIIGGANFGCGSSREHAPWALKDFGIKSERIHTMNQLLKAYALFEKDIQYVVMDNKVMIVDEQTGRIMDGRRYSDGLHQAIEAKENVKIEAATQTFATVTLQNYFRMYRKLSGMTGTAVTEAGEFWEIYKLDVIEIPTNRPIARDDRDDLVYKTKREKYNAVIEEVTNLSKAGRQCLLELRV